MSRTAHRLIGPEEPLWAPHHPEADPVSLHTLGFWLYMMSDALIFAALFAAYAVLDHPYNAAGGPQIRDVVHPVAAFIQTIIIFTSVFAYSLAMVGLKAGNRAFVIGGLVAAVLLGAAFLGLELRDFAVLIAEGATPDRSGLLSVFFVLVATHGIHMVFGILWMLVMIVQVAMKGFTTAVVTRLLNLRIFWMFQASIWVCVFVFVYLNGAYR
ncbi:MAG: cytochrome O ubiquinol oxidase [Proteobacteria bacterium]|nr:cytochrome O ubiquinol oxidase [Pseudomonadota bacterium]